MNRYPGASFVTATPESEGVRSTAISQMLTAIRKENKDIHSMLIWRHGKLLFEEYFAPYDAGIAHSMYSCSKTFTSMLIGIAQGKGLLSVEDRVLKYFPDVPVESPGRNLRAMKIKDLLMMGSGNGEDTFGYMLAAEDGDWARAFLNRPVEYKPGTHFVYNTGATYMLSAILTRVTGKTALELANEWIFRFIGIEGAEWDACPKGISMGGTGLHIRPRDMLRFGILLLSGGRWNDRQVIPRDYVLEAQTKKISNRNPDDPGQNPDWAAGYCYQMWRCSFNAFRADGMGGQFIVMLPQHDMVVVFTSALGADIGYPLQLIAKYLLPGVMPAPLIPVPAEADMLRTLAEEAARPEPRALPRRTAFPFGAAFPLPENRMGLSAITVEKDAVVLRLGGEDIRARFFWDAPRVSPRAYAMPGLRMNPAPLAVMARWEKKSLYLRVNCVGEPNTLHITLTPVEGGSLNIRVLSTRAGELECVCATQA